MSSRPRANRAVWHQLALLLAVIIGGCAVGFLTQKLMGLSLRYAIAFVVGLGSLAVSMVFIRQLPEVLLYGLVACTPLLTFEKTFMRRDYWVDFGTAGINIGLIDILLAGLYVTWFIEIAIARTRTFPKLRLMDWLVFSIVLANLLSVITSASVAWSLFEVMRVVKYALAYFYIAHRLERRHLRGIVWCFMFALVLESSLGVVQHRTHKLVGIGRSKGAATAEMNIQYEVPAFESHRRAEGTTIDSHALGIYMVCLLMYPFCLALSRWIRARDRMIFLGLFLVGIPGLIATFSRGAWGAMVIACVTVLFVFFLWKERRALGVFIILSLLATPAVLIGGGSLIGKRIFRAPSDIMSARWDTILGGYEVWKTAVWTGGGTNAYKHALYDLNRTYELTNDKPAHNLIVYILSQTGLIGLITYYTVGIVCVVYCWRLIKDKDPLLSPLALAALAGFIAIQADGAIDFMSVTNQVYFTQFITCGLIVGMLRLRMPAPAEHFAPLEDWKEMPR